MRKLIIHIGKGASWFCLVIVILMCFDVLMRYMFNSTQVWLIELEWHLFGGLFLLAGAWSWLEDRHVRVDIFYTHYQPPIKKIVNTIGHLFLAFPWIVVTIYASFKYAGYSWEWREGSPDPGGLPARYIIKYCITAGFTLLLIACLQLILVDSRFSKST